MNYFSFSALNRVQKCIEIHCAAFSCIVRLAMPQPISLHRSVLSSGFYVSKEFV